jgi:hypothetical protein
MATYQRITCTTANQFLIDLSAFFSANGWTVDSDGVYNASYRRLHVHKGAAHFDLYSSSATNIYAFGCTDYAAASAPNAQPGNESLTLTGRALAIYPNYDAHFISVAGAVYIGVLNSNGVAIWSFFVHAPDKIGNWSGGGAIMCGGANSIGLSANSISNSSYGLASAYVNGAWTKTGSVAAGSLCGLETNSDLSTKQPMFYNQGIMPLPVGMAIRNATDTSLYHPLLFLPGVYRANGGTLYDYGESLTIGGETYKIIPRNSATIGTSVYGDYLFKLGN